MTTTFLPSPTSDVRAAAAAVKDFSSYRPERLAGTAVSDKPLLRGRLHQLCAVASVPAGMGLLSMSAPTQWSATLSFTLTWTAMFTTSASYHRLAHSQTAVRRLRRADHSMIFVHIGGSCTALSLLCMPLVCAVAVLAVVWLTVLGGIAVKLTRLNEGGSAGSWIYGLLGLTVAATTPIQAAALSLGQLALLIAGGLFYGVGAILFFRKRLDLFPTVFGYHEVWHCFTLAGSACFYLLFSCVLGA